MNTRKQKVFRQQKKASVSPFIEGLAESSSDFLMAGKNFSLNLSLFSLLAFFAFASQTPPSLKRFSFEKPLMGTYVRIVLYAENEKKASHAFNEVFSELQRLEGIFSDYVRKSEVRRLSLIHI